MFNVICLDTGELERHADGSPVAWGTPQGATRWAEALNRTTGLKHQLRRAVVDHNAWKVREGDRFRDGTYTRLPWHEAPWYLGAPAQDDHFAHVSKDRDGMVAFTLDATKGAADIQTRIKPGRYLTRYFSDVLSWREIEEFAQEFAGLHENNELLFAHTSDEIEQVYLDGPSSCMSKPARHYDSPIHPVRVYGAGDLAVAYIKSGDSIGARVLCWPAKKLYSRIYGDDCRLRPLLDAAGYDHGELYGARMLRIEADHGGFVVPYLDGCNSAGDNGEYLVISSGDPLLTA